MKYNFTPQNLPEILPVFPLEGVILLPGVELPLRVFEPRYVAMLEDILKQPDRLIGMIQPSGEGFYNTGCAGRLTGFSEHDDGEYMIVLKGISRFQLGKEIEGKAPYRLIAPNWTGFYGDLSPDTFGATFDLDGFIPLMKAYFDHTELTTDWEDIKTANPVQLINTLASHCPFCAEEKQLLLESADLKSRFHMLEGLMRFALSDPSNGGLLQ